MSRSNSIPESAVTRPDGLPMFHLGIAPVPGACSAASGSDWDAAIDMEMAAILAWEPDMVLAIETPSHAEILDELTDALGEVVLETIDSDHWPVPAEADIVAERREILCHALAASARRGGGRVLIVAGEGREEAATLAAELLMIAGHLADDAMGLVEASCPGCFNLEAQREYLLETPEGRASGALQLPFEGGILLGDAEGLRPAAVLRADGLYGLSAVAPVAVDMDERADPAGLRMLGLLGVPEIGLQSIGAGDLRIHAGSGSPLDGLADYAKSLTAAMARGETLLEVPGKPTYRLLARIDEEDFRSMPQG